MPLTTDSFVLMIAATLGPPVPGLVQQEIRSWCRSSTPSDAGRSPIAEHGGSA
jgi:hypothetical protein